MSTVPGAARLAVPGQGVRAGRRTGASLVEMMIALAVGAIVILGLAEILSNTRASYLHEEAFARVQENGRIATAIVAEAMRSNRSMDCKSLAMHTLFSGSTNETLSVKACDLLEADCTGDSYLGVDRPLGFDNSQGLDDKDTYELPSAIATSIADRWVLGDVLVGWGIDPTGVALNGPLGDGSGDADGTGRINLVATPTALGINDIAVVSNCKYAHVFKITGPEDIGTYVEHAAYSGVSRSNASDDLRVTSLYEGASPYNRNSSDPRAILYPLDYRVFYICCVHDASIQTGSSVNGCRPGNLSYQPEDYRPALCVYDLKVSGRPNAVLVPNVADLRVTYSGDTDGDGALDFRADDTSPIPTAAWLSAHDAWSGVRSAAVELLLTAESGNSAVASARPASSNWPPNTGTGIDGDTLGADYPADRRLYQRFRFDVALRPSTLWTASN